MIKNFLDSDNEEPETSGKTAQSNVQLLGLSGDDVNESSAAPAAEPLSASTTAEKTEEFADKNDPIKLSFAAAAEKKHSDTESLNTAESIRMSGMAYSAAIVLTASVVFMLLLGWFADLVIGSAPWGIVIGIVLGSLIGFVQFFRITSGIFRPRNASEHTTLFSSHQNKSATAETLSAETSAEVSGNDDKDISAL